MQGTRLAQATGWLARHPNPPPPLVEFHAASCNAEVEAAQKEREAQEREITRQKELRQQAEARAEAEERLRREADRRRVAEETAAVHARRSAVLSRRLSYALGVLFLIAAGAAIFARWQQISAQSRELAAKAEQIVDQDQPEALALAIRGWHTAKTAEASLAVSPRIAASALAMNEWGYAQVAKSVSAIAAISFPPYACCGVPETAWSPGFLLTCESFLNGRFLAIAASPDGNVEYQWFPHCVVRTQTAENLQFSTRMFLPSKQRAVVQSITIRNLSAAQRHFRLAFDMRGAVAKKTKSWFVNSPGEVDNRITWDAQRGCLLFEAQHSEIAAAQGFHPAPS